MRIQTKAVAAMTALILMPLTIGGVMAQVPEAPEMQAQVAAMTLESAELPTGYILSGETFLPLTDGVEGLTAHYVSVYTNMDSGQQIRSYAYAFDSDEHATAGFETLEGNEAETLVDKEIELGSGKAELTTGTFENSDGTVVGTADVTFVRGSAVIGVAVDSPDGSQPDVQLAQDLATTADTRAQQSSSGDASVDLTLTTKLVPFSSGGTVIQSGFVSSNESEAIYGTQGSALTAVTSSYVQTVAYGESGAAPRVTIGVSKFSNADDAKKVVEQADQIFQPLPDQEKVDDFKLEGSDAVVAYRYTSRDGSTAERESFRIIFSQGEHVTVIDVQGAADSDAAEAAANAIAAPQLTCQTGGACERPVAEGVIPE